ncbi:unnamed protein product, partial [marine sediment metagenome]
PNYITGRQLKHLNRDYTKGTVTASGQVMPFALDGFVELL